MNHHPTHEWLNNIAKKAHENAANKGFYEGEFSTVESRKSKAFLLRQKNLIRGEIGEAYEALRKGGIGANKLQDMFQLIVKDPKGDNFKNLYKSYLKGTLGEELADIVIRALDCAGALQIKFSEEGDGELGYWREGEDMDGIFDFFYTLADSLYVGANESFNIAQMLDATKAIRELVMYSFDVANYYQIDIKKHVELKMLYNSMREHKHGKKF